MQLVHKKMYACFLKDDLYLSLCLLNQERSVDSHVLVGSLPFKVYLGVRFIHGNELNQDFVRVLIGQKKKLVQIAMEPLRIEIAPPAMESLRDSSLKLLALLVGLAASLEERMAVLLEQQGKMP